MKKHLILIGIAAAGALVGCSSKEDDLKFKAEVFKVEAQTQPPNQHRVGDSCARIPTRKLCHADGSGKETCRSTPVVEFDPDGKHIACFNEKDKFVSIDPLQGWGILVGSGIAKAGDACEERKDGSFMTDKDYFPLSCEKGQLKRIPAMATTASQNATGPAKH